jgi:WD40 repeat protein
MTNLQNQNILKLIFQTYHSYNIVKQLLDAIKNKSITQIILTTKLLDLELMYKSIGNSKIIIESLKYSIYSLFLLPNGNFISIDVLSSVKLWNTTNYKSLENFNESFQAIIALTNNKFATSNDISLMIWDFESDSGYLKIINTISLIGYRYASALLLLSDENVAYATHNKERHNPCILILDSKNEFKILCKLTEHALAINTLENLNNDMFASGSDDYSIKIWKDNGSTYECLKTIYCHNGPIIALLYLSKENLLVSGCLGHNIKVWNINDFQCINTVYDSIGSTSLLLLENGYFASGSVNKKIKVWRIRDFKCINVLEGHKGPINALISLKDNGIVSASNDRTIIIWNY